MFAPASDRLTEQIDGLFREAMTPVREQIDGLLRDAIPPVGPDWSAHIADLLNTATAGTGPRRDLATILDRFDEIARDNPDLDTLLPDDPDADLGEIGEEGLAFVAAEGVGLSREAQRRMFLAFVFIVVFGTLMTAVVSSETASGLLEDSAVPGSAAMLVLAVAARKYDQAFPQPGGDSAAGTGGE